MSVLLKDLNPEQQRAVEYDDGPLLILAGAGSGKTRALTYRAAYLISEKQIDPNRILLTTFTNKAAGEMQERLEELVGFRLSFAGTFHSLCARLLRIHGGEIGLSREYVIYDGSDQLAAIKQVMKQLKIDEKETKPRAVLNTIESAKHEMIGAVEYADFARGSYQQTVARVYRGYQKLLSECEALDFSDLLLKMIILLNKSEHIREKYQEQFLYVLVDEYQDTNKAQYQLTKILSKKHRNLCVVGDASQAIYSWRGADYRNLSLLQQDFPDLQVIKLEQNYRSTQNILSAADEMIANNTLHPVLNLWSESKEGELISVVEAEDEYDEVRSICRTILKSESDDKFSFDNFAVLYRTNAQSRVIEEMFIRKSIPYQLVGGVKFYERKEVKDVLSYLRYSYNRKDQISYERLVKLGKRRLAKLEIWLETADMSRKPIDLLDEILKATTYLSKYSENDPEDLARIENVNELRSVAQGFDSLGDLLENIALVERGGNNSDQQNLMDQGAVTLMTIHASKGLEFEEVFIIGLEEGLFPHSRSLTSKEELEEERRLCYVGITRAKERLSMSHARSRLFFGTRSQNNVSRFIGEMPSRVLSSSGRSSSGRSESKKWAAIDDEALDKFLSDEIDIDEFLKS